MDRDWEPDGRPAGREQPRPDSLILPSRATALSACREALAAGAGPFVLTGEPGSGKTWLWHRLAELRPEAGDWIGVDLAPDTDARALYGRIGRALRLSDRRGAGADVDPRRALADAQYPELPAPPTYDPSAHRGHCCPRSRPGGSRE